MADIQLTCPGCGRSEVVSESVRQTAVTCPACGRAIVLPERQPENRDMKLKWREPPRARTQVIRAAGPGPADSGPGLPALITRRSESVMRDVGAVRTHRLKVWLSWLIFLALAGGLAYIRFYGGWPALPPATLQKYGMLAVAAAYLFVIGLALRDNMFEGLLAIVIPLYPFYYLFFTSSALFVRALVGALLVAFGYDSLLYLQGWATVLSNAVHHWIRNV